MCRSASSLPMLRDPECSISQTRPRPPVEADLDEVVAAAERAHLPPRPRLQLRAPRAVRSSNPPQNVVPAALLQAADPVACRPARRALSKPTGMASSIARAQRGQVVGRSAAVSEVRTAAMPQPMSTPTAAGETRLPHRDHRADRRALAEVHVGHDRDVVHPRQRGDVAQLPRRLGSTSSGSVHIRTGARVPGRVVNVIFSLLKGSRPVDRSPPGGC